MFKRVQRIIQQEIDANRVGFVASYFALRSILHAKERELVQMQANFEAMKQVYTDLLEPDAENIARNQLAEERAKEAINQSEKIIDDLSYRIAKIQKLKMAVPNYIEGIEDLQKSIDFLRE